MHRRKLGGVGAQSSSNFTLTGARVNVIRNTTRKGHSMDDLIERAQSSADPLVAELLARISELESQFDDFCNQVGC